MDNKFKLQKDYALKSLALARLKGEVDLGMLSLIDYINSLEAYYTTSSCTGRISLLFDSGNKKDSDWVGKWHRKITFEEVKEAMQKIPVEGMLWFMQEPTIIHINCRTLEDATKLVDLSRNTGYKKVGILSYKDDRIIVEVNGTERINAPIAVEGKIIVSDEYIKKLIELANNKYEKGMKRLTKYKETLNELEKP